MIGFAPVLPLFKGASDGSSLSSYRQGPDGGQQRFAREQQDQAPLPAQSAAAPVLGRRRESLGQPAPHQRWPAHDRQEGHRSRPRRASRQRPARLIGRALRSPLPNPANPRQGTPPCAKRSSSSPPPGPATS